MSSLGSVKHLLPLSQKHPYLVASVEVVTSLPYILQESQSNPLVKHLLIQILLSCENFLQLYKTQLSQFEFSSIKGNSLATIFTGFTFETN